jgi:hypothetical protein
MEFKETKIIKTFFVLEKKEFGFSPKDRTKNQILFSNRRLMPMHSKKPKPAATTATHLPLQFSPLSLEEKKKKNKNTTIEPVTNKTTKPRHSRQQRNDPASRSRKKKRTRKAKTPADSSDHDSQRNRPGSRC